MVNLIGEDPPGLPLVITREEALASGLTGGQIQHRLRTGRWRSLHYGTYVREWARTASTDPYERARDDHVLRAMSAAATRPQSVLGHTSAALAHGLPLISGVPRDVHLVVPPDRWSGRRGAVRVHRADLAPADVTECAPWEALVTSVARTWVDVARTLSVAEALSVGDRALRERKMTARDGESLLRMSPRIDGGGRVALALAHCDGRRETPLESLSWARFLDWKIPLPLIQHDIWDGSERIARVDFVWPELGLIGEADGRLKYQSETALWDEKRRELRLWRLGFRVVRWTWADVRHASSPFREVLMAELLAAA